MNKTDTTPRTAPLVWSNFRTLDNLSIQDACIAAERARISADRKAKAEGADLGTFSLNW